MSDKNVSQKKSIKNLLQDEKLLFVTNKHWIIFANTIAIIVLTLIAIILAQLIIPKDSLTYFNNPLIKIAISTAIGIAIIATGIKNILTYITAKFAITDKRIIMQEGFFYQRALALRLSSISNMQLNQTIGGRILNYGDIVISPFGGKDEIFLAIYNASQFQRAAQIQLDKISTGLAEQKFYG